MLSLRIIPKLSRALRAIEVTRDEVEEDGESFAQFGNVVRWVDVMSDTQVADLLEGDFFPQWFECLTDWICSDDIMEMRDEDMATKRAAELLAVERWYGNWKTALGTRTVERNPRLEHPFRVALRLVVAVASGEKEEASRIVAALPKANKISYDTIRSRRRKRERAKRQADMETAARRAADRAAPRAVQNDTKLTFRDVVEIAAAKNGVSFLPNPRKGRVDGKQIYDFGEASIYLDRGVAFVQKSKGRSSQWIPVDFSQLEALAKGK